MLFRSNSGTTVPASKIYNNAGIPQISPAATTPLYTRQGYKTAFRVVASDSLVGHTLAAYSIKTLKAKRIAVIDDRTAFGQGLADEFTKGVKAVGGAQLVQHVDGAGVYRNVVLHHQRQRVAVDQVGGKHNAGRLALGVVAGGQRAQDFAKIGRAHV